MCIGVKKKIYVCVCACKSLTSVLSVCMYASQKHRHHAAKSFLHKHTQEMASAVLLDVYGDHWRKKENSWLNQHSNKPCYRHTVGGGVRSSSSSLSLLSLPPLSYSPLLFHPLRPSMTVLNKIAKLIEAELGGERWHHAERGNLPQHHAAHSCSPSLQNTTISSPFLSLLSPPPFLSMYVVWVGRHFYAQTGRGPWNLGNIIPVLLFSIFSSVVTEFT